MLSSPCIGDNCDVVEEDEPPIAAADETPDPIKTRTASNKPQPMYRSCIDSACLAPKPITAKPQVGRNPAGGLMVYFGTGKYTDLGDNFKTNQNGHYDTFYGLHDNNELTDRGKLVEQTIMHELEAGSGMKSRITSVNPVNYPEHQGWFMNLLTPPDNGTDGEQVISQALLREGRLIFVTLSPSQSECAWDGSSWVMELNALDGNRLSVAPIDINNDKQFTSEDSFSYNGKETIISGVKKESVGMLFEPPAIITHSTRIEGKYLTGTGGTIEMLRESNSRFSGRMSWKKLR
jgi:type IV pilus assembly protein PilY1